jgi:autotransporter translocation and assembly factor TamB
MIVRWSMRILLSLFLVTVVLGGLLFWLATRTSILEDQANAWLDSFLSAQLPIAVTIGDIGGEPWQDLSITDIRVDEIQGDSLALLLHIDTVRIEYDWRKLIGRQWHFERATLAGIQGVYRVPPDGRPTWLPAPDPEAEPKPLRLPLLEVRDIQIRNVAWDMYGGDSVFASLENFTGSLDISDQRISVGSEFTHLVWNGKPAAHFDTVRAELVGFGKEWFAENILVRLDSTRITGRAHLDVDSSTDVSATLHLDPARWNDISRFARAHLPGGGKVAVELNYHAGVVRGRGTINGTILDRKLDGLGVDFRFQDGVISFDTLFGRALGAHFEGSGELDIKARPIAYGLQAELADFNLRELVFGALESDLAGTFIVAGVGTTSEDLRVNVTAYEAGGFLGPLEFDSATGLLTVNTDSLYLEPGFSAKYLDMDVDLAGKLDLNGDMDVAGHVSIDNVERVVTFLGYPGAHGRADGTFILSQSTTDPALDFGIRLDSVHYKAVHVPAGHVRAHLTHAFSAADGRVKADFAPLVLGDLETDSGFVSIRWKPDALIFDTTRLFLHGDTLGATARLSTVNRSLTVQTLGATLLGRPIGLPWDAELTLGPDTLYVHNVSLVQDAGSMTVNGWMVYGEQMGLQAVTADVRLGPWLSLTHPDIPLDGYLFAELNIGGTVSQPDIAYRLRLQDASYTNYPLGDLVAGGSLTRQQVVLDSVILRSGIAEYMGSGVVPLHTDTGGWSLDRNGELDFKLKVEGGGMRLAGLFLPEVETLEGDVSGNMIIGGSLYDPQFEGQFTLWDGDLKVWSLRERFSPVFINVTLQDSLATVGDARLTVMDRNAEIKVGGDIIFHGLTDLEYDLTLRGQDIPLSYEYANFTGRFDVDLKVTGEGPPLVSGRVDVIEAVYGDPLEATDSLARVAAQVEPDTTKWNVNTDVKISNNAWVKNRDVNAEFSGDVRVLRDRGEWNYLGRLEPIRGSYYLFGRKFRNLRGEITFDDVHEVDPQLDLEADVNLPMRGDTTNNGNNDAPLSYQEITVKMQGRLSEPQIIPPSWLGERNFILALNPFSDAESAAGILTGEAERWATREFGVETFELRPSATGGYSDWTDARLRIGAYLLPDVYVYGGSAFDPSKGQEAGFEYRLRNWLRVQGNRSYDNLYQFDLNLNWEISK